MERTARPEPGCPWRAVKGVGRDSAIPLLASIDWRPTPYLHVTLWGGVSVQRSISVLDRQGGVVNQRDVEPAGLIGGTVALAP